ncbi:hypothetical protein OCU04_000801 [Sclerotinia nivalis]|uniref:2EXR domain-containing protein n=1 Tax=Sclerotinia nivalis TaxID=352851 RepID=A0A9X0DQL4_9HELO|nr:hypothetical protein OCU04_000801 [Sclerotinia nivalis]
MANSQPIDSSDNHNMDIDNHEDVSESDDFHSENDDLDGFDDFEGHNMEESTMSLSDIELEDGRTALTFKRLEQLPEELQMNIWKFVALHVRRTIIMKFEWDSFMFANCPPTPAFMHVCRQARKYGLEIFKPVDARGVPRDIENNHTCRAFYFYVNPISDDFILKFGDETFCPRPVYCPIESNTSYPKLRAAEMGLQNEYQALVQGQDVLPTLQVLSRWLIIIQIQAHHPPPPPGEPVFPAADILPQFFTNIRSVGINLDLPFSRDFDFSQMNPNFLRNWARDAIKTKFDDVFTEILDHFPKLEYAFAVVRAHGRSSQDFNERFEPDKKNWRSVGMANGEGVIMGKDEFKQLEYEGRRWFMERIDGGGGLNRVDFELYVQRNIYWEI